MTVNDYLDKLKALLEEAKKKDGPCPSCGHCPHCGRGGHQMVPWYPAYPVYPTYPWYPTGPVWISSGWTSDTVNPNVAITTTSTDGLGQTFYLGH